MAETTRPTSGTPTQTPSTSASPGTSTGGARNPSTPASRPGPTASTANEGQRSQTQQQDSAQRSSSQGQQRQQSQSQQSQSQQAAGSQIQGKAEGEHGDGEHHIGLTGDALRDVKKVGSELASAARESANSLLEAQRARVAEQIVAIGEALRHSAESFESTGAGALVQYVDQAADQICEFADTVRDRSWNDIARDVESFARRHPTAFMLSALGLGFIAGRFMLSSSERMHHAAGGSGTHYSGGYSPGMQRDAGVTSRTVPSGARAEYGSGGIRE